MSDKVVVAIAGLACENSTFSPSVTQLSAFKVFRGAEVVEKYPFLHNGTRLGDTADWRGTFIGQALPGGIVSWQAYNDLAAELIKRLTSLCQMTKIHGLWFDIHGAMSVAGEDDIEADLLRRIRAVIGPDVVVSASMDLHGNVSQELAHQVDLITCYRTAPHVDVLETKERACRNLIDLLHRSPKDQPAAKPRLPLKAWIPIPVLLPGEKTSTRMEPAKRIYAAVPEVEALDGVIDAAVWVGYAWADEPRNRAVVVVTGWDKEQVVNGAEKLANHFWDARDEFEFVAPHGAFADCLDAALRSTARPYFISDSGDNPTAGGAGDVTWTLENLLARPEFREASGPKVIYASIPAPEAVRLAVNAGVGATVTAHVGADVDNIHAGPVRLSGRVTSIYHGDPWAETEVVIQVGSISVVVTKLRKPYHRERDFINLSLDPRHGTDIVIVKIGYLEPELFDMAADWILALTPGGVDQRLEQLDHCRITRPMSPFDTKFVELPDLTARLIPHSHEPYHRLAA